MSATACLPRAILTLAIACTLHSSPVTAQSNASDDMQAIRDAAEHFLQVFGNLDWEGFRATWASEPTVFFPFDDTPERITGKQAVEARWQRFFSQLPRLKETPPYFRVNPRELLVQRYGDAAIVTFNLGTGPVGRRTLVFVKENGNWKVAHLHASAAGGP